MKRLFSGIMAGLMAFSLFLSVGLGGAAAIRYDPDAAAAGVIDY